MTDVKAVRNVQQKVAEGNLLRFRFGKNAQTIRNVTQLYYTFVKNYHEPKEEPVSPEVTTAVENASYESRDVVKETIHESNSSSDNVSKHSSMVCVMRRIVLTAIRIAMRSVFCLP